MLHLALLATLTLADPVGKRPYELDWAGRAADAQTALVDFEQAGDWKVEAKNAEASFQRSREQQIFGEWVGKLTYRGLPDGGPTVMIRPPAPIPVGHPFDAVSLWIYGNNWGFSPNPATPQVGVTVHFAARDGSDIGVYLWQVDWEEWNLLHRRLTPEQVAKLGDGASFTGLEIARGTNKEDRVLYFDSLCAYTEALAPLTYRPRAKRGQDPFPGQDAGINTGEGRLPFPTRAQTILPPVHSKFTTSSRAIPGGYEFVYAGDDGKLTWRVAEENDALADVTATWQGKPPVRVGVDSGLTFAGGVRPTARKLLASSFKDGELALRWQLTAGAQSCEATYTYRLWGKSLVVDVKALGGQVAEVRYGRAQGLVNPKLVQVPYYVYSPGRPMVAASGTPEAPLFLMANTDWYRSNASELFGAATNDENGVAINGGARYLPKTDGRRNDVYERLFLTLSPRFDEVLPVIDNPTSPYKQVTGSGVWLAHGATNRDQDAAYFREAKAHGLDKLIITDHETMWRDNGESFTFRTRTAPGRGGDASAERYTRILRDELGYVYGPYNNYTDFAPVNEFWNTDNVARGSDGQLQHAWMRCYAPKPVWAVGMCERIAPEIQRKFNYSTAYCDVHTALAPWHRTDYDARTPGAGTFAQVLYAWGEILMLQRQAWRGPVYSEGNHHVFLHGVVDGNYAQDQNARLPENPWLVDFDLRRMHDLGCNFGMGAPDMFYGNVSPGKTPAVREAYVDRFLTATVAFGHPGFLVRSGWGHAMRSYFMVQALAARYTQAPADTITYFDAAGKPLSTSAAVVSGAIARDQLSVSYGNGARTVANGSLTERLRTTVGGRTVDLPPCGYAGWTADGEVEVYAADVNGQRVDYAAGPDYLYFDGRGAYRRYKRAAGNGPAALFRRDGAWTLVPEGGADAGFDLGGPSARAEAFAADGKSLGAAEVRHARGLVWVQPVKDAVRYRVTPQPARPGKLDCDRYEVTPGETVTLLGGQQANWTVPIDAKPGSHLWHQVGTAWIDFVVVPAATVSATVKGQTVSVTIASALPTATDAAVSFLGVDRTVRLAAKATGTATFELPAPTVERLQPATLRVRLGQATLEQSYALKTLRSYLPGPALPRDFVGGYCLRGGKEERDAARLAATGGQVTPRGSISCGGDLTATGDELMFFMHPPYMTGVGYSFALLGPVTLPADTPLALRAMVGKADGSDLGDGIWYYVSVVEADGKETRVAEQTVARHEWKPLVADLTRWAGKTVRLKLVTDVGPADNSSGDWGAWGAVKLRTTGEHPRYELTSAQANALGPSPLPLAGLKEADLRGAKSAVVHFEASGLEGTGTYASFGLLNGLELGNMPSVHSPEGDGKWAPGTLAVTPSALAKLGARNSFAVRNDGQDYFKIRRAWLEVTLADGRRVGSRLAADTYTQPPGWTYLEGTAVPFGESISFELWFDLEA